MFDCVNDYVFKIHPETKNLKETDNLLYAEVLLIKIM